MIDSFRGKNRFLSNFHMTPVTVDGLTYPSSEHAYMAQKCDDPYWKTRCQNPKVTAKDIKKASYTVKLVPNWDNNRLEQMEKVLTAKFTQNDHLQRLLVDTADQELIEGNAHKDTFWGVCEGIGENHLGNLLMKIRETLKPR